MVKGEPAGASSVAELGLLKLGAWATGGGKGASDDVGAGVVNWAGICLADAGWGLAAEVGGLNPPKEALGIAGVPLAF